MTIFVGLEHKNPQMVGTHLLVTRGNERLARVPPGGVAQVTLWADGGSFQVQEVFVFEVGGVEYETTKSTLNREEILAVVGLSGTTLEVEFADGMRVDRHAVSVGGKSFRITTP